jgi:PKD repeat protein
MTDIAGNPRLSGTIDIGCYEYQKTELVVRIDDATPSPAYAPSVVTFKHTAENSETQVTFTYNYGDGSDVESTTDSTITHTYQNPGVYTVTITASNGQDEPATMVYNNHVQIASTTIYVTPGNGSGTFPYNTPESGFGNFKSAVQYAADGYTLLLGEGVHETVDQVSFNKALTIRGLGASPEAVIVRNTVTTPDTYYHRVLEVNNGDAFVSNLTLENGCVRNQNGGNLRLVLGVVSNCVIRGGLAVADNGNAAGAAVEISGAGMLTHCVVSNNVVQGTSNSGSSAGGAIYFPWAAKNGQISNCLIAYNRYVTSGEETKSGAAGIRFNGGNEGSIIENNTIVANTVEGSLADDSAAIHCTTYRLSLRNNILFGNTETGKGKYTTVKLSYASDNAYSYHNNITDDAVIAENGNKSKNNILVTDASKLFKNYANGDFRPSPNGAAYNRGTTEGLALLPAVDLGGGNRVKFSDKIDIGCYESQNRPGFVTVIR